MNLGAAIRVGLHEVGTTFICKGTGARVAGDVSESGAKKPSNKQSAQRTCGAYHNWLKYYTSLTTVVARLP